MPPIEAIQERPRIEESNKIHLAGDFADKRGSDTLTWSPARYR